MRVSPWLLALAATALPAAAAHADLDLTHLRLGDGKVAYDGPRRGYVYECSPRMGMSPGLPGPWISGSYWDFTTKPTVDGEVNWTAARHSVRRAGSGRAISGNGLPFHTTGVYPIAESDDAYQYDRNPNSIAEQTVNVVLPASPVRARRASCSSAAGAVVGFMNTGAALFNALDAGGKDAPAHEIQDSCDGHPERTGQYHYHSLPRCIFTGAGGRHSRRIGWARDGFPVFGPRGAGGEYMLNRHLDGCHGHEHTIRIDGRRKPLYHYHATMQYPYTLGCYRGTAVR